MRAIVIGGAGFIGSHLVDALLERGDDVHVIDNLSSGRRENLTGGAELHALDTRDEGLLELVTGLSPEAVFHLAAQSDVGDVAAAFIAAAAAAAVGAVNIGTGVGTSVLELYRLCAATAGVEREPVHREPRPGDLRDSVLDPALAARELGWRPATSLADGLARTWAG